MVAWSRTTALLAAGAVGAVVAGPVWIAGGNDRASGRAGGGATADAATGSQGYRSVREWVKTGIDVREWAPDEPDPRLLVDQGDAGKLARPGLDPAVLAGPVVRGVPATVWKTRRVDDSVCVFWAEGSVGHRGLHLRRARQAAGDPGVGPRG